MKTLCIVFAVISVVAAPVMADVIGNIDFRETGTSLATSMTIYGGSLYSGGINGLAGIYTFDVAPAGPIPPASWTSQWGFCIEMQTSSPNTWLPYEVRTVDEAPVDQGDGPNSDGTMGTTKANLLALLWGQHIKDVKDVTSAAAFQAAVWEIVYENKQAVYDVGSRDNTDPTHSFMVSTSSGIVNLANGWLRNLDLNGAKASLVAYSAAGYQDYITAVPAPGAALLIGLGLGLVGWLKRRIA